MHLALLPGEPTPAAGSAESLARLAIRTIVTISLTVIGLGIARELLVDILGPDTFFQEGRHFDLDGEANLPAWWSSIMLFSAALTAGALSALTAGDTRSSRGWAGLGAIFVLLSLDEVASFHEAVMDPLHEVLNTTGVFHYGWLVPAIPLLFVMAAVYAPFILRLPRWLGWRLLAAAGLFVLGAVGMEMIGGILAEAEGETALSYHIEAIAEEMLEITGLSLALCSLITFMAQTARRPAGTDRLSEAPLRVEARNVFRAPLSRAQPDRRPA